MEKANAAHGRVTVPPARIGRAPPSFAAAIVGLIADARWLNRPRVVAWSGMLLIAELLGLGFLIAWTHGAFVRVPPLTADFVSFYAAGKLALAGTPALAYDQAAHLAAEIAATMPGIEYNIFFYPPVALLLFAPLAALPHLAAFILFEVATLALWVHVAGRILAARGWNWCLPVLAYPAIVWTVGLGQNALLTASLLGAVTLLADPRPIVAGLILGLLCYKPHLALLVPLALAAGGYWRAIAGAALSVCVLTALSVAVFGQAPWLAYVTALPGARGIYETGRVELAAYVTPFGAMRVLGLAVRSAYAVQLAVTIMVVVVVCWIWRRDADPARRGAALAAGILLSVPLALFYDLMIAAVAILWLVRAASRGGFMRWEKLVLSACFMMPLLCRYSAPALGIPLAPLAPLALLALAAIRSLRGVPWRSRRRETGTGAVASATPA